MQALAVGDKDRFLAVELEERRIGEMPLFGRLAALIFAGGDAERVKAEARQVARAAPAPTPPSSSGRRLHPGLAAWPIPRAAAGQGRDGLDLPGWLRAWLGPIKLPSSVRLQVDVDPVSFL